MATFLGFILWILLMVFILGVVAALTLFSKVRNIINQVKEQAGFKTHTSSQENYQNQEGVFDTRSSEEANKKIFAHDEGEYVEFTEEG